MSLALPERKTGCGPQQGDGHGIMERLQNRPNQRHQSFLVTPVLMYPLIVG
jgi:hypothetical protein